MTVLAAEESLGLTSQAGGFHAKGVPKMAFPKIIPKAVLWSPHTWHIWPSKSCGVGPGQGL